MTNPDLVVVYESNGPLAAEVIKGKLESAGIPVLLKSEANRTFAFTIDGMGTVEVLVPRHREAEARDLISKGDEENTGAG